MRITAAFLVLGITSLLAAGCGQSNPSSPAATETPTALNHEQDAATIAAAPQAESVAVPEFELPGQAVDAFLKALRDGDEKLAGALLTAKAREETAKRKLIVQPPGTPSATFKIGNVEYLGSDKSGAHVSSTWTEQDGTNDPTRYDIVWALRRQPTGWRIAGMATQVTPIDPPVFLNFEDPDDMLEKWRAAEEKLAAQPQVETRHADRSPAQPNVNINR